MNPLVCQERSGISKAFSSISIKLKATYIAHLYVFIYLDI